MADLDEARFFFANGDLPPLCDRHLFFHRRHVTEPIASRVRCVKTAIMKSLVPLILLCPCWLFAQAFDLPWAGYGHDAQHTAISATAAQGLNGIHWSTPVDLNPQTTGGDLYIHYGSAAVTAGNTVF